MRGGLVLFQNLGTEDLGEFVFDTLLELTASFVVAHAVPRSADVVSVVAFRVVRFQAGAFQRFFESFVNVAVFVVFVVFFRFRSFCVGLLAFL